MSTEDLIPHEAIAERTVKACYRVTWDSTSQDAWWPGEHLAYSLGKGCFVHEAICDTLRGAHAVYREVLDGGGTNVKVLHWTVVTITTKAEELDIEQEIAKVKR